MLDIPRESWYPAIVVPPLLGESVIKIKLLSTTLTDKSKVYDIAVTQNESRSFIVGCLCRHDAENFGIALRDALKRHTNEHVNLNLDD